MDHASTLDLLVRQTQGSGISFDADPTNKHLPEKKIEIERIEDAVSHIQFPLSFTDQLYILRSHIDIVRRKLASRANAPARMAAE